MGKLLSFQKPAYKGYVQGYIFDKPRNNDNDKLVERNALAERQNGLRGNWSKFFHTPLKKYTFIPGQMEPTGKRFDFMRHLLGLAGAARESGKELWVADIGAGTGKQWIWALNTIENLRLALTSLSDTDAHPAIREKLVICSAAEIHLHLPKDSFHLAVSHYGTYHQQKDAFENILYILRPGGEAIVSCSMDPYGKRDGPPPLLAIENPGRFYEVISFGADGLHWMYHVKKALPAAQFNIKEQSAIMAWRSA